MSSSRKRLRRALKTRAAQFKAAGAPMPDAITAYRDNGILAHLNASDIEQVLAENRALRGAYKAFHAEIGSLNTQLAAARAHRTVVIPARPAPGLPEDVSAAIAALMEDLSQVYEPEAAAQHLLRVRETLKARANRIQQLEMEHEHMREERTAYRQALEICAKHAYREQSGPVPMPTPDNLQGYVCRALSRAKDVEAAIRAVLA